MVELQGLIFKVLTFICRRRAQIVSIILGYALENQSTKKMWHVNLGSRTNIHAQTGYF